MEISTIILICFVAAMGAACTIVIWRNTELQRALSAQKKESEDTQASMTLKFEQLANRIIEEKGKQFSAASRTEISALLQPLGESLKSFRERVDSNLTEETRQRAGLGEQVRNLVEQTNIVSREANNLAQALKGQSKTRGNWGELILSQVLVQAGLQEGRDFVSQKAIDSDSEGERVQIPDVIVRLPNDRSLIIDSKITLVDYDEYCSATNPEAALSALKRHTEALRRHIDRLSAKSYQKKMETSPDFVMMFLPIEPAYMAAIEADSTLWQYAYNKNVMLVCPSNLLPCLRLINDIWTRDRQNRRCLEIVKRGEAMYDKFAGFVGSLQKLGIALDQAKNQYDTAYNQLSTGQGNLLRQAEMMKELGLKPTKQLPEE